MEAASRYAAAVEESNGVNSSMNNMSTPMGVTTMEVYTGALVTILLLTAALFGAGVNAAFLVAGLQMSGKGRGRSGSGRCTNIQYGLHYALAATHLLLCCVWLPIHIVQMLTNMQGAGNPRALCLTSLALWNICVALVTFLTLFLAIQRLYRLSLLPARMPVIRGLGVSAAMAAAATTALCIEYPWNADQQLCETGQAEHGGPLWFSVAAMLFMLIYVLVLLLAMLLLGLATAAVRRKLSPPTTGTASNHDDDPRSSESEHTRSSGACMGGTEQPRASSSHHDSVGENKTSQHAITPTDPAKHDPQET